MAGDKNFVMEEEIHLRDYYYVLMKRKKHILVFLAVALFFGFFFTVTERVIYEASTTLQIEKDNPNVLDFKEVMSFDASSTDYYQTQYQILKGSGLIRKLIREEALDKDPYLRGLVRGRGRNFFRNQPWVPDFFQTFLTAPMMEDVLVSRMLRIKPVRNSQLVTITILHPDSRRAAAIANTLAALYIEQNLSNRYLVSEQAMGLISGQMGELKTKVAEAERRLQAYKEKHSLVSIPSLHEKDQFLQEAKLALVKLQSREARMAKRYLEAHPKRIHLRSEIEGLEDQIKREETKTIELGSVAIKYDELEREADSAGKVYKALLDRLEQTQSEAKAQASNITVVDQAVPEPRPSRPRPFLNLMIALFFGAVGGCFLAFFLEYLDSTIKVPEDIERGAGLDLFGIIPEAEIKPNVARGDLFFESDKSSAASEALRALRTSLLFRFRHIRGCRVILMTSPNPQEGKTTLIANLAMAFQQNHLRVLLIDADLRKPRLHKVLNIAGDKGLTEVLESELNAEDAIHKNVGGLGFDFLSSGVHSYHPTELLGSEKMETLMERLQKDYDIILIDSPPYLAVADVIVLSEYANAIVSVAAYRKTDRRHLQKLKQRFAELGPSRLLGVVINKVNVREKDLYYHQYYYYGYGDNAPSQ